MTILEALNWGQQQLKKTAAEKRIMQTNPMLDSQILLSQCLEKSTAFLFAHADDELKPEVVEKYQNFITRRKKHEPISQILQQKEFFGRNFFINQFVLTPRPETELLIENALEEIKSNTVLIDVGTGSGAIAVTLASETQNPIIAIDIDPKALTIAKYNAKRHKVDHLISFLHGSLLKPYLEKNINEIPEGDLIIFANLPYLTPNQWNNSDPDLIFYEPKHALVGGIDGLELYNKLLQQISNYKDRFPKNTLLYFEIDPYQESGIKNLIFDIFKQAQIKIIKDHSGQSRIVKIVI